MRKPNDINNGVIEHYNRNAHIKKHKKSLREFNDILEDAKKEGLTYGYYVAKYYYPVVLSARNGD